MSASRSAEIRFILTRRFSGTILKCSSAGRLPLVRHVRGCPICRSQSAGHRSRSRLFPHWRWNKSLPRIYLKRHRQARGRGAPGARKRGRVHRGHRKKTTCIASEYSPILFFPLFLFLPPPAKPFQSRIELHGVNWVTARLLTLREAVHAVDYAFVWRYTFSSFPLPLFYLPFPAFFLSNATE